MRRWFRSAPELWALLGVVALFFWRPLTTGTFFFRDIWLQFYGQKVQLSAALRDGTIPAWNPMTGGGQPSLAGADTIYYPGNLLFFLMSGPVPFNLLLVFHFLMCAAGAWWLARTVGLGRTASLTAGLVYALCGYTLSSANLLVHLLGLAWAPLTIALAHRAVTRNSRGSLIGAALCTALPLVAGAVESTGMMVVILVAWLAVLGRRQPGGMRRTVIAIVFIVGFAGALSLVQVVPATEVVRNSSRGEGMSYERFTRWSVNPRRLPELIAPGFAGRTQTGNVRDYWGRRLESDGFPYILSLYIGWPVLLLGAAGGLSRRSDDALPHRALLILAAVGLVLSLGRNLPGFEILYRFVPLVKLFRYPVKALMVSMLPLALLAGRGIEVLAREERSRTWTTVASGAAAALSGLAALSFAGSTAVRSAVARAFFGITPEPLFARGVLGALAHAAVAAAVLYLVLRVSEVEDRTRLAVACVVALDLISAGAGVNVYAARDLFEPPPIVAAVKGILGDGRFFSPSFSGEPIQWTEPRPQDAETITRSFIAELSRYSAAMFGIPVTLHEDFGGLAPLRMRKLAASMLWQLSWSRRIPILQRAGVHAFIGPAGLQFPDVHAVATVHSRRATPQVLYALTHAPRARFVSRAVVAQSENEASANLLNPRLDTITVEGAAAPPTDCGMAGVRTISMTADRVRYQVTAPCDGFVAFAETFYPEWHGWVDGVEQPIVRSDYAFSAMAVTRGVHTLERAYTPKLPRLGALLSLAALVVLPFAARWAIGDAGRHGEAVPSKNFEPPDGGSKTIDDVGNHPRG